MIASMDTSKIYALTIHCAATPEGRDVPAAEIDRWDVAKFGQPSYHHIVELSGRVVRGLRDNQRGAHVGGRNTGVIGVCYVGGVDRKGRKAKDTRTPEQREALARVVRDYLRQYPGIRLVNGHRDWPNVRKDCPSFDVASWLREEGIVVGGARP